MLKVLSAHFDTGRTFERALKTGLGDDFEAAIPPKRRRQLSHQITTDDWTRPLSFARAGVRVDRNIAYGDVPKRNTLDIYRPMTAGDDLPVLLQIHGGAWLFGHKAEQALPLLHHMAGLGWVCVSINYRLSPAATFPDHIIDVKKAIAWVREHIGEWGGDARFIAVTGGSAGGHLASLAALSPNYAPWQPGFEDKDTSIQAAMPLYGAYDLCDRYNIRHHTGIDNPVLERVMKTTKAQAPELFDSASPITWVSASAPPFFVVQGANDTLVWVEEARRFVADLSAVSLGEIVYAELDGAQHSFDTVHSPRTSHFINAASWWLEWSLARWRVANTAG
jgi:acetyl esterase/lipase